MNLELIICVIHHNVITLLNRTPPFEWYTKKIARNVLNILQGLIVNTIRKAYMIT